MDPIRIILRSSVWMLILSFSYYTLREILDERTDMDI